MLRELGAQSTTDMHGFFQKWRTRIFFGSDILTMDEHLEPSDEENAYAAKASGVEQAFELYASRYFALRMLFEGTGTFESPIVDADLNMVDPDRFSPHDAPTVQSHGFDPELLKDLYRNNVTTFMNSFGAAVK